MLERGPQAAGSLGIANHGEELQERDQDGHHAKSLSTVGRTLNVVNKNRIFVRDRFAMKARSARGGRSHGEEH